MVGKRNFNDQRLYIQKLMRTARKWITAPERAGRLEAVGLRALRLRPINNDCQVAYDDHDADPTATISRDRDRVSTSCRDGSGFAEV